MKKSKYKMMKYVPEEENPLPKSIKRSGCQYYGVKILGTIVMITPGAVDEETDFVIYGKTKSQIIKDKLTLIKE